MADVYLLDSVKVATPTTGTGSVTVGAAEPGYLTPAEAGAVDGRVYTWRLDDGDDFEIFRGTYSSSGPTVSRDTVLYSKISGVAGTTKLTLSGAAKLSAVPVVDYVVTPRQIREILTADRTYYVRTDGNDNNTGLSNSPGGAFKTIQKAIDTIATLDIGSHDVTIQVGDGTYTDVITVTGPWRGSGSVTVVGNTTTPANVVLATPVAAVTVRSGGRLNISGFTFTTGGHGLYVETNGVLSLTGPMVFGTCMFDHVSASYGGIVLITSNYTITGGCRWHWNASEGGNIVVQGRTITLMGTPTFNVFARADLLGSILCNSNTFSGSANGTRFSATMNGSIQTFGAGDTYLPGNASGVTATGGQYG